MGDELRRLEMLPPAERIAWASGDHAVTDEDRTVLVADPDHWREVIAIDHEGERWGFNRARLIRRATPAEVAEYRASRARSEPAEVAPPTPPDPVPANPDPAIVGHAVALINNHVGWMGQRVRGKDEDEDFRPKDDVFFEVLPAEVRESVLAAIVSAARLLKRSFDR